MVETIKQVLMTRDEMSSEAADELINEAKAEIAAGENPEDVLSDFFGLEPDYIFCLI